MSVVEAVYCVTYFVSRFAFRVCKNTLVDMSCISSFSTLNIFVSIVSFLFLFRYKTILFPHGSEPPLKTKDCAILILLLCAHFFIRAHALNDNLDSMYHFSHIIGAIYAAIVSKHKFTAQAFTAFVLFLIGSFLIVYNSLVFSSTGFFIAVISAVLNTHIAQYLDYPYAMSGHKAFAAIVIQIIMGFPKKESLIISPYPIFLLFAATALDVSKQISASMIFASYSLLPYMVIEQFCEIGFIMLGQTLHPSRFATLTEAAFAFVGFALAIPGFLMFIMTYSKGKLPDDMEPFYAEEEDF